jgi:cytochrome c556
MKRLLTTCAWLAVTATLSAAALAADAPAVGQGMGWTGITNPKDVITARQELMEHIEILMEPIDTITVKEVRDVETLHSHAELIGAMLLAVPHLFPPTTNLYDPKVQLPATLALPTIWKDFGSFYKLAAAASHAAETMATAKGDEGLRAASRQLRASCDACHALFLRKYLPPKVQDSDYKFDFNSAIRRK